MDAHFTSAFPALDAVGGAKLLAERAEEAVEQGVALLRWCRHGDPGSKIFPLALGRPFRLPYTASGYFASDVALGGEAVSVMGCRQRIRLDTDSGATAIDITEFMTKRFFEAAYWETAGRRPGGFRVSPLFMKDRQTRIVQPRATFDWSGLVRDWEWALLRIDIHEFELAAGPFRRRIRQAAFVAPSADFLEVEFAGPRQASVTVGYPFVRVAPLRNPFGFGPGKFTTAIKTFTLRLEPSGELWLEMNFAAAPRCEKVLDFGPGWPDPVYGSARLAERLSRGRWKAGPFRDRLDAAMLAQHGRVHHALIEGIEPEWRRWLAGRGSRPQEAGAGAVRSSHVPR